MEYPHQIFPHILLKIQLNMPLIYWLLGELIFISYF